MKAQANLEELQGFSLGRAQHLVQLAVKRKILGYQGGQLAPYVFCEEARKKRGPPEAVSIRKNQRRLIQR